MDWVTDTCSENNGHTLSAHPPRMLTAHLKRPFSAFTFVLFQSLNAQSIISTQIVSYLFWNIHSANVYNHNDNK